MNGNVTTFFRSSWHPGYGNVPTIDSPSAPVSETVKERLSAYAADLSSSTYAEALLRSCEMDVFSSAIPSTAGILDFLNVGSAIWNPTQICVGQSEWMRLENVSQGIRVLSVRLGAYSSHVALEKTSEFIHVTIPASLRERQEEILRQAKEYREKYGDPFDNLTRLMEQAADEATWRAALDEPYEY